MMPSSLPLPTLSEPSLDAGQPPSMRPLEVADAFTVGFHAKEVIRRVVRHLPGQPADELLRARHYLDLMIEQAQDCARGPAHR